MASDDSERTREVLVSWSEFVYNRERACAATVVLDGHVIDSEVGLEREQNRQLVEPEEEENWWDFCPICNTKMINLKCKYICPSPKCNFFMSCSEFDR